MIEVGLALDVRAARHAPGVEFEVITLERRHPAVDAGRPVDRQGALVVPK